MLICWKTSFFIVLPSFIIIFLNFEISNQKTKKMSKSESRGLHVSASSSKLVQDAVNSLNAEKVWPSDAVVYTNLEQQELLMDVARLHVVRALFA